MDRRAALHKRAASNPDVNVNENKTSRLIKLATALVSLLQPGNRNKSEIILPKVINAARNHKVSSGKLLES